MNPNEVPDELNDVERSLNPETSAEDTAESDVDYRELYLQRVAQNRALDLERKKLLAKIRWYKILQAELKRKLKEARTMQLKRRARERFHNRMFRADRFARKRVGAPARMMRK